jgi:hypothetical protein
MPLPTNEQLSKLSPEQLVGLWRLVREFRLKLMGAGPLPISAIEEMEKITPDRLMSDIVNDNRKAGGVPAPSGLIPDEKREVAVERGSGWQKPTPLEPPSGIKYVDQIADHFAAMDREQAISDAIDRVRKIKG